MNFGNDNEFVKILSGKLKGKEAAESLLQRTKLRTKEDAMEVIESDPEDILNSSDPVFSFIKNTKDQIQDN